MSCVKDFSCIGGLEKQIRVVKETVLFPLMYGDVYAKFNLKPPRGLLFYGPPGTGKTLVASALAVECSNSERKVSFISRKGSDCLSKWVGESEKKLQKIFSLAQQSKPCIIFFDEVDGLAPVRSSRQDFVHASIVSTLLALMDGLENNSEIIVIGATNRIDAIDPALRRPGRFDRELYFPLPCYTARKEILSVHIKSWKQKPPQKFLAYLASKTVGFCGSDLQALCAEAVMCCVRRNYPEIYTSKAKYQINERHLKVEKQDFLRAQQNILPASHRVSVAPVKSLSYKIQPLLQDNLSRILSQLQILCPPGMLICDIITGRAVSRSNNCPRILLYGDDDSHTRHLGPALLHTLEHLPCHVLDVTTLFEETGRAAEEALIQKMKMARRSLPSLLYIPDILAWWNLVDEAARVVFTSLMHGLDRSVHMLILITANCPQEDLPADIASLFDKHRGEMFEVTSPDTQQRESFFKQLFVHSTCDLESNCSSQAQFEQIMNLKKTKEVGRKRKAGRPDTTENLQIQEASFSRRSRLKVRNRICTVRSAHVMTNAKSINNRPSKSGLEYVQKKIQLETMNTETVNSFESSSNSSIYEESNSRLNLDNALLMDESLSDNSDESFYDTMNRNTSIAIRRQSDDISNTSEYYDSTSFFSLPDTKFYANCKNENPINVNNSQHQQDVKAEKKNNTHAPVSLKILLRQMFDEILGKSDSAKQTNGTDSTGNLDNEFLSSNNNLTDRSNNTFEKNNNSICQTKKFHMIKTSTEDANDLSKINASPSCDTYTLNRLNSERLITILENSNESSSNSQLNESNNWSGKCIGKLKNFFSWKLNNKCTNKQIFSTSEISDNISISSDTSTEIDIVNKEIFQKINDLQANDSLNVVNFQFRNKIIVVESTSPVNSVKNEVNSASSNYEEYVCPDTFFHSSKTETKKLKDHNRIGKKTAKRRSLSMSENNTEEKKDQDSNDNKNNNKSKTPHRMDFFNRTNIRERKSISPRIIASPIKPVTYLRKVFMDMEKKNKVRSMKHSPMHKLRQTKVPFISVTPATPEH